MITIHEGRDTFLVDAQDLHIGRSILARGMFEIELIERTFAIIGRKETVYDIGANIGSVCIPILNRDMCSRAVAIEPDPYNFRLLRANLILNDLYERVETHQIAAGAKEGTVQLELANDFNLGDHRVRSTLVERNRESIDVQMRRLSWLEPTENDIVWMDVQGYEAEVLEGWPEVYERRIPLVVEFCPDMLEENDGVERMKEFLCQYSNFVDIRNQGGTPTPQPIKDLPALIDSFPQNQLFHADLLLF